MVLSHHGCNAHHKPGPLVAFRFSCWSLEITYDKMSFYEAYQTWIFLSQVFGWYLKLPNCVMSKSSHLFFAKFFPSWLTDWLRSKSDRAWWRSFDVTPLRLGRNKNHWNLAMKNHDLPKCTREFWALHKLRNRDINTLNRHQPAWLRKDSVWPSNALKQFFGNPWVESKVFHLSTLCGIRILTRLTKSEVRRFLSERVEGTVLFFFRRAYSIKKLTICEDLNFLQRFVWKKQGQVMNA